MARTLRKTTDARHCDVSIIPLGGVGEIGKNCWVFECNGQLLVLDCGQMFPDEEMLGVDMVIPDMSFLVENRDRLVGMVLTHGHEDHIGAAPYLFKALGENIPPLWGTRLALGLLRCKLEEHGCDFTALTTTEIAPGEDFDVGAFHIETIRVNHSIPDSLALGIHTPSGVIVHSGDFKFDHTPVDGKVTQFGRLAELGNAGVMALISDCTNVERPGHSPSEKSVRPTLERVFSDAAGRIIIATFASNIHRVQQILDVAQEHRRVVAVIGRSMVSTITVASELGYLTIPDNMLIDVTEIDDYPDQSVAVLTTGSQGEPLSALSLIARQDHKWVNVRKGDTVIISATPIPGNEALVHRTINQLFRQGAEVIYDPVEHVHATGHAHEDELRMMLHLVRPQFVVPTHGEDRHLVRLTHLAREMGYTSAQICMLRCGEVLRFRDNTAKVVDKVPHGSIMVDGLSVGDVGNAVLRDRKHLAEDGVIIVVVTVDKESAEVIAGPDLVSRGFVYTPNAEALMDCARENVSRCLKHLAAAGVTEGASIRQGIKESLGRFVYEEIKRRPMILPIVVEV